MARRDESELGVIPPERCLEEPPAPGEGEVLEVEFDRVDNRYRGGVSEKHCQTCHDHVELTEPHVRARVTREGPVGTIHSRPVFCDCSCWVDWSPAD